MAELLISIEPEAIFHIFGLPITNSYASTLILMVLLILFARWYSKQKRGKPSKLKIFADMALETLLKFLESVAGPKAREFFPLLATFFLFIILGNWLGLLPGMGSVGLTLLEHGQKEFIPLLRGPTADLNTTLALALISVTASQVYSIQHLGFKIHLKKFLNFSNPIYFMIGILEFISEISKVISFSFRLFGNVFAGEVLLAVMGFLIPYLAPLPFLGLEFFVGFIQALVFTMLSLVFWTSAIAHQEEKPATQPVKDNLNISHPLVVAEEEVQAYG